MRQGDPQLVEEVEAVCTGGVEPARGSASRSSVGGLQGVLISELCSCGAGGSQVLEDGLRQGDTGGKARREPQVVVVCEPCCGIAVSPAFFSPSVPMRRSSHQTSQGKGRT